MLFSVRCRADPCLDQSYFPAMTKIVGTLGPKSRSVDTISACLKAGMSGNCSLPVSLSQCRPELAVWHLN